MIETKVIMPAKLTAENGAKQLFIGEFYEKINIDCTECDVGICYVETNDDSDGETIPCPVCNGTGEITQRIYVSWTTIKAIYDLAVSKFGTHYEHI